MPTSKKKTAAKAAEPVGAAMAAGQETFETAIQAGAEAFKGYEDFVGYGKDSVDAVMKSNALFVKGFLDINQAFFGLAQASLDNSVTAEDFRLQDRHRRDRRPDRNGPGRLRQGH